MTRFYLVESGPGPDCVRRHATPRLRRTVVVTEESGKSNSAVETSDSRARVESALHFT